MNVVMIFDLTVPNALAHIKILLLEKGYLEHWTNNDRKIRLPNNVVWKKDIEQKDTHNDLKTAIATYNLTATEKVDIKRYLALPASPWTGIQGLE